MGGSFPKEVLLHLAFPNAAPEAVRGSPQGGDRRMKVIPTFNMVALLFRRNVIRWGRLWWTPTHRRGIAAKTGSTAFRGTARLEE